uniref:hypothetical protein n=1 Tax=Prevotella sp. TaxID=59823 RepID=UPI004027B1BB
WTHNEFNIFILGVLTHPLCVFMYSTLERSQPLRGRIAKMRLRRTYSSLHQLINVGLRNILQYQDSQFGLDIITILSTAESISST